jgi:hypothetical protein
MDHWGRGKREREKLTLVEVVGLVACGLLGATGLVAAHRVLKGVHSETGEENMEFGMVESLLR